MAGFFLPTFIEQSRSLLLVSCFSRPHSLGLANTRWKGKRVCGVASQCVSVLTSLFEASFLLRVYVENKAACRQRKIFVLDNEERNEADAGRSLEKDGFFILNLSTAPFKIRTRCNCIGDEIRDKCRWFRDVIESSGRLFSEDENVATRINIRFCSNQLRGKIGRQI